MYEQSYLLPSIKYYVVRLLVSIFNNQVVKRTKYLERYVLFRKLMQIRFLRGII